MANTNAHLPFIIDLSRGKPAQQPKNQKMAAILQEERRRRRLLKPIE